MSIQADFKINGVNYRLLRGGDNPSYRRKWVRARGAAKTTGGSNPLRPRLTQTTWAGGSAWWKPSIEQLPDSYYTAAGMNLWRKAGQVEPWNRMRTAIALVGSAAAPSSIATLAGDDYYIVFGADIWKYTASTDTWADTTHNTYGSNAVKDMLYDPLLDVILLFGAGSMLQQYDGTGNATQLLALTGSIYYNYGRMLMHDGRLMIYTGKLLLEITNRDTTPAQSTITDDGLGPDWLTNHSAQNLVKYTNLAVSTTEGLYYVKNVEQNGQVMAYIFRVERDEAGNWNSVPIATLPPGNVALSIGYHLGSVVIAAADHPLFALTTSTATFPVVFYHITGGNIGVLGVPLGEDVADETPYSILGSEGGALYIAGQKRLWVYDGIHGGIHPLHQFTHESYGPPPLLLGKLVDTSSSPPVARSSVFIHDGTNAYELRIASKPASDLTTVTNFGDDLTTYVMESNYFEFGEPLEVKDLTAVSISTDQSATTQARWTIQVSIDDGSWTTLATFEDFSSGVQKQALNDAGVGTYAGYRFRYRAIYETKSATVSIPLRAIGFEANVGQLVREWTLIIDGTESMNIENERQDPADVYDNLETLGGTEHAVQCVDYYQDYEQNGATYMATVEQLEIVREAPGEGIANVVLAEFYEGA